MKMRDYRLTKKERDELTEMFYEKGSADSITYLFNQYQNDQITVLEFGLYCAYIEGMNDHSYREFENMLAAMADETAERVEGF